MGYFDSPNRGPRSNLLTQETSTPVRAPNWMLWKHRIANDAAAVKGRLVDIPKSAGLNCETFKKININAVARDDVALTDSPGGTSTLTVTPYEWSDGSEAFVPCSTATTPSAGGAGEAVQFSFDSLGKILYFHISGLAAGESVSVYGQGFDGESSNS